MDEDLNPGDVTPTGRTQEETNLELARLDALEAELGLEDDGIHPDLPRAAVVAANPVKEAELEASKRGWVPKSKWVASGKEANQWVDAQTFNKRGEQFNKNLQTEVAQLKNKLAEFEGSARAFAEFQKGLLAQKDAELQTALRQLRLQHKEAIRNGDDDEALELEDKIDAARASAKAVIAEVKAPVADPNVKVENPVLDEWVEDGNQWFQENEKLRRYAVALGDQMIAAGEPDRGRKFLDKVAAKMREEFPKSFRAPKSGERPNDRVNGGSGGSGGAGGSSSGSSFNGKTSRDLPPADRALMRQFIAEGMYTEESYLKSYFSRN